MHAQLRKQRIVERRHGVTLGITRINPDAVTGRFYPAADSARAGEKALGILGVDPQFDGVTAGHHGVRVKARRKASGREQLLLDEVDTGHQFGDRMLDLQPRIHLEEVERALAGQARRIEEELDGAGAAISDRLTGPHRGLDHAGAQRRRQHRARRLLGHLLVATLHRTVALTQGNDPTVGEPEDLHLDVSRARDVALEQDRRVAEEALCA